MWFKNLFLLKISNWKITPEHLEDLLSKHAYRSCTGSEMETFGWTPPKGNDHPLAHRNKQQILVSLGVEKKLLPSSIIEQYAESKADEIEAKEGNRPGRKQMREIKESVAQELLPRAFALKSKVYAWIDPVNGWLVVNAATETKAAEVFQNLQKIVNTDVFSFALVKTNISPSTAMTGWLAGEEAPSAFTVDRDCELRDAGEEKATVRYVHHNLDSEEIPQHIKSGKTATKLAMTWMGKISFVLTENFQLKRISPLDLIEELGVDTEDVFDGDFTIMSGELALLLNDLISALGGLQISEHSALPSADGARA